MYLFFVLIFETILQEYLYDGALLSCQQRPLQLLSVLVRLGSPVQHRVTVDVILHVHTTCQRVSCKNAYHDLQHRCTSVGHSTLHMVSDRLIQNTGF